ncbi:predicted protein [Histoplasma capsulatum var. duboisii H88]|uniref:Predicted protein n=1 Tax=Ajellomyces capsulatus (strain H88) TaxID=544711 RepID=F0UQB6_AJEC8|nr:predicted protein [Histoplasma capsulatum var. duboisii H88]
MRGYPTRSMIVRAKIEITRTAKVLWFPNYAWEPRERLNGRYCEIHVKTTLLGQVNQRPKLYDAVWNPTIPQSREDQNSANKTKDFVSSKLRNNVLGNVGEIIGGFMAYSMGKLSACQLAEGTQSTSDDRCFPWKAPVIAGQRRPAGQ